MKGLSKDDGKVVEKWWRCSREDIVKKGFTLNNYRPSVSIDCCKLHGKGRSFRVILKEVGEIVRCSPFS
jgi:hypothetical protein